MNKLCNVYVLFIFSIQLKTCSRFEYIGVNLRPKKKKKEYIGVTR